MEVIEIQKKIKAIRNYVQESDIKNAVAELIFINENIEDKELKNSIIVISSRFNELRKKGDVGLETPGTERVKLVMDILNMADETENHIRKLQSPEDTISLDMYSNENIRKVLNMFTGAANQQKVLSPADIADNYDTKVKLYNLLFSEFDKKLESDPQYNKEIAGILFDRLIAYDAIEKSSIDTIQGIRNNKHFAWYDRSLIVSGLTIGLINRFDSKKLHLLIDFLTDFEEHVWEKALAGLILALCRYDNRLSLFPEISDRLEELKKIESVQSGITIIEKILRYRTFSGYQSFKSNPQYTYKILSHLFGERITISKEDLEWFDEITKKKNPGPEDKIVMHIMDYAKLSSLKEKLNGNERISLSTNEFYAYYNIEKYIELFELNPFQLEMDNVFFKSPKNYFRPFLVNEELTDLLVNEMKVPDVDIREFIDLVKASDSVNSIDRYFILYNIGSYSDDFVRQLNYMLFYSNYFNVKTLSVEELRYLNIIREIYRFQKLAVLNNSIDLFDDKLQMYNKSLLEKVAEKTVIDTIHARVFFDQKQFDKSLTLLLQIEDHENEIEVMDLIAENYFQIQDYVKASDYAIKALELVDKKTVDPIALAARYQRLSYVFDLQKNSDKLFEYKKLESEIRFDIARKSLSEDQFADETRDKLIQLSNCYFDISAYQWNFYQDIVECFAAKFQYLDALTADHTLFEESPPENFDFQKNDFATTFNILLESPGITGDINQLLEIIKRYSEAPVWKYINTFFLVIKELKIIEAGKSYLIHDSRYTAALNNADKNYEELKPEIENFASAKAYDYVSARIISPGEDEAYVSISLVDFLANKDEQWIMLCRHIAPGILREVVARGIDDLFANLFKPELLVFPYTIEEINDRVFNYISVARIEI